MMERAHAAVPAQRKRILALDYGQKRIGLAISDEMRMTATPLGTFVRTNRRNDLRRLRELARQHGVAKIVIGHPLNLDGTTSSMAGEAARFAERVQKDLGVPVELVEERLSTWEAANTLQATKSRGRRPAKADDVAAAIILREYLEQEKQ